MLLHISLVLLVRAESKYSCHEYSWIQVTGLCGSFEIMQTQNGNAIFALKLVMVSNSAIIVPDMEKIILNHCCNKFGITEYFIFVPIFCNVFLSLIMYWCRQVTPYLTQLAMVMKCNLVLCSMTWLEGPICLSDF